MDDYWSWTGIWRYECGHNFVNKSEKWKEKRANCRYLGGNWQNDVSIRLLR